MYTEEEIREYIYHWTQDPFCNWKIVEMLAQLLNERRWIPVTEQPPPIFSETQTTFLAAWIDSGSKKLYGIDWYSFDGEYYHNMNSGNYNYLGVDYPMFSHWMPIQPPQDK